jgi:FkbM family methyltransferase
MFEFQGIWFPDGEKHFPEWMAKNGELVDGRGTYQIRKFREAMKWCKQFRGAIDVGGHVGLWSMQMVKKFLHVEAFEPVESFRKCFVRNVGDPGNYTLWPDAVGATSGTVSMVVDRADTGGSHVKGDGDIPMRPLDLFEFAHVDFLKVDVEGVEADVILGGEKTIRSSRPCIVVEQKQHIMARNFGTQGTPAVDILLSWGAKHRGEISGDHILSWDY